MSDTERAVPARGGKGREPAALAQVLGLGCLMAWTYVTFFSRLIHYSTRNDIEHLNSTYAFACCGMIAAYLLCALARRRGRSVADAVLTLPGGRAVAAARVLEAVAAAVLAVCTVVLAMVEREFFKQPWCSIASTVAGAAVALLSLGWGARVVHGPGGSTTPRLAAAFLLGALAFVATLSLPEVAGVVLTALLPLLSLAVLCAADARAAVSGGAGGGSGASGPAAAPPAGAYPAFVRSVVALALLSLAESLVRALFLDVDPAADTNAYRWLFLSAMCIAAGVFCLVGVRRSGLALVRWLTRVSMLALAFLVLLSPIVHGLGLAADLPPLVCHCLFNLLVWVYLAETARAYRIETHMLFGLALAVAYAGCLAGTFAGSLATSFLDLGWRAQCLAALGCACLVLVSFLFIADERTLTTLLDADDERPQAPRRFRLRVEEVARAHGLTAKETEVLMLAAKGRTTQRICEELGISTGTANTHLMHIYKKLDVHDRQQMIDLLDARAGEGR